MKKKILSVLMVAAIMVTLVACGEKESSSGGGKQSGNKNESGSEAGAETKDTSIVEAVADENGNYILNGSFEEVDFTGWKVTNVDNVTEELDVYTRETDCFEGVQCLHFYSGSTDVNFTAEQTLTGLEAGTYKLTAHIQGEAAGDENAQVYFYVIVDGETFKVDGQLNGYVNWYTAELPGINVTGSDVVVGINVTTAPGGWGTIDDITLVKE